MGFGGQRKSNVRSIHKSERRMRGTIPPIDVNVGGATIGRGNGPELERLGSTLDSGLRGDRGKTIANQRNARGALVIAREILVLVAGAYRSSIDQRPNATRCRADDMDRNRGR